MIIAWLVLSLVGIVLIGWGIFSTRTVLYPPRRVLALPDPLPPVARHVLRAPDGVPFEVWRLAPDGPVKARVLLCHGYYANRAQVFGIGQGLLGYGYESLLMELRGHGERPGPFTFGIKEAEEIGVILRWARALDGGAPRPIAALGFSMGGAILCQAALRVPELRAVILDSVYGRCFPLIRRTVREEYHLPGIPWAWVTWGCVQAALRVRLSRRDPITLAPRLRQPLLAIQGGADQRVSLDGTETWYARWAGPKERWFDPEAIHVGLFGKDPDAYCRRIAQFLDRTAAA